MKYIVIEGMPEESKMSEIEQLHLQIFTENRSLYERMQMKPFLVMHLAYDAQTLVGYKIGYERSTSIFYSWLGGVHADYRGRGIALQLMNRQHLKAKKAGYSFIETKTMNRWRNMLIVNIQFGFDVVDVEKKEGEEPKILLRKHL
ncbi:GNAT family N-acetyltransferase [Shouchella sp. 1P09AA]|uniref:GNAT family N-acetyltransferase n=1 Tax=unclassified Shouchella TaxID=2893065 RepID=UPI0039A03872